MNQEPETRLWISSEGEIYLHIRTEDIDRGYHSGDCHDDIVELRKEPYIADQLAQIDHKDARSYLSQFGSWDDAQLADHDMNLNRILWLACGDLSEILDAEIRQESKE